MSGIEARLEFRAFRLLRRAQNGRCGVSVPIFGFTYHQYAFAENHPPSLQRLAPDASSLRQKARNSRLEAVAESERRVEVVVGRRVRDNDHEANGRDLQEEVKG